MRRDVRRLGEQLPVPECNPNRKIREAFVGAGGHRMTKPKAIKTNRDRTPGSISMGHPASWLMSKRGSLADGPLLELLEPLVHESDLSG